MILETVVDPPPVVEYVILQGAEPVRVTPILRVPVPHTVDAPAKTAVGFGLATSNAALLFVIPQVPLPVIAARYDLPSYVVGLLMVSVPVVPPL